MLSLYVWHGQLTVAVVLIRVCTIDNFQLRLGCQRFFKVTQLLPEAGLVLLGDSFWHSYVIFVCMTWATDSCSCVDKGVFNWHNFQLRLGCQIFFKVTQLSAETGLVLLVGPHLYIAFVPVCMLIALSRNVVGWWDHLYYNYKWPLVVSPPPLLIYWLMYLYIFVLVQMWT